MTTNKVIIMLAICAASVSGYGQNQCRKFTPENTVQNFTLDNFLGQWYPIYQSKSSAYLTGKCPTTYFERLVGAHKAQAKRIQRFSQDRDYFMMRTSYKGQALIADNLRKYRGYFDQLTSSGSQWTGPVLRPLQKFKDNFQIVSTDYETYAIIYQCTHKTAMYDKEDITVLSRVSPALEMLPEDFEDKVRSEFERIFGQVEPTEDDEITPDDQFLYPKPESELMTEAEEAGRKSRVRDPRKRKSFGKPLNFDKHLQLADHKGCKVTSYPDLSLSLVERNKLKQQQKRAERKTRSGMPRDHQLEQSEGQN